MAESATGRHDRDGIVTVALRILDEQGLADLTMRRLAGELGVRASALYWHFASKQDLLAAVADRIVGDAPDGSAASPDGAVSDLRDALLAHRDGAEVVMSTRALSAGDDAAFRRLLASLTAVGLANPQRATGILLPYALGHASIVQQRLQAAALGVITESATAIRDAADAEFDDGVRTILAGLGA